MECAVKHVRWELIFGVSLKSQRNHAKERFAVLNRSRRTPLIRSSHMSLGTGHPRVNETLSLLKERFWWSNMARDVRRYVQGCQECPISKSPHHLPSGKLHPLPVLNRP
ncbi:Transposon Tf2-9 polyprotein [Anabarilius grahami]|uniref:Gypsy retrotransposon integrase-like protein 1 n=1 Tax=Anabarilius grahami TaxID=495550 RepID=A0A3N0YGE5_ANAGA|nr:Transposon Tf2-9 polyprotein [Anabarilius grahami]